MCRTFFSTVREKIVYARLTTMTFVCAVNIYASGAQSNLEARTLSSLILDSL